MKNFFVRSSILAIGLLAQAPASGFYFDQLPTQNEPNYCTGNSAWMQNPTYTTIDGTKVPMNPCAFATQQTANAYSKQLSWLGPSQVVGLSWGAWDPRTPVEVTRGTVGPFVMNQPDYQLKFQNGAMLSAGLVALTYSMFDKSLADAMVANDAGMSKGNPYAIQYKPKDRCWSPTLNEVIETDNPAVDCHY